MGAQPEPACGRMTSGPNSSNANTRCGKWLVTCSMRASFASRCGSFDSFHIFVRWKGDAVFDQKLPQPFPSDLDRTGGLSAQIVGELAHAPPGERPPQGFGAGVGRRGDVLLIVRTDLAGTATLASPISFEPVDDLPDRVLVSRDETGDRRHWVPTC
jgi:hypothetical protein